MSQSNADQYVSTHIEGWLHRQQPSTTIMEIPELGIAVGTSIGQVRQDNQDRLLVARLSNVNRLPPTTIFAVCDGLGGMVGGAQCAEKTLAKMLDSFIQSPLDNIKDRLRASIVEANQAVFSQYRQRGGTTLALLCRTADSCFAVTVGDTRVYSFSLRSLLKQISVDDTIAGELKKTGIKGNTGLEQFANQLAQFVGIGPELEPRFYDIPLRPDMSYLIASDGAYNIGTAFEPILTNASSAFLAVKRIITTSLWMGGKDNATIIYIGPDSLQARPEYTETTLELWNTSGKLEMIGFCHSTHEKQSTPMHPDEQVNDRKDFGRKVRKPRYKAEEIRSEQRRPTQNRPILEINFGNSALQDSKSTAKDRSAPQSQANLKLTMTELRPTAIESEDKKDGPRGSNISNS